jgi:hypothetical protein
MGAHVRNRTATPINQNKLRPRATLPNGKLPPFATLCDMVNSKESFILSVGWRERVSHASSRS